MQMKTTFHMKRWAPGLALKKRPKVIRKWPIGSNKLWDLIIQNRPHSKYQYSHKTTRPCGWISRLDLPYRLILQGLAQGESLLLELLPLRLHTIFAPDSTFTCWVHWSVWLAVKGFGKFIRIGQCADNSVEKIQCFDFQFFFSHIPYQIFLIGDMIFDQSGQLT